MFGQEKYERLLQRRPHTGRFYDRPHWTRRRFMELMGAGVTASFLPQRGWTADLEVIERASGHHSEPGQERHLHSVQRWHDARRHLRSQGVQRRHARNL